MREKRGRRGRDREGENNKTGNASAATMNAERDSEINFRCECHVYFALTCLQHRAYDISVSLRYLSETICLNCYLVIAR